MDRVEVEELGDSDLLKAEKSMIMDTPLFLLEEGYLTIKTKSGMLERLKLNSVQGRFLELVKRLMIEGKPVRVWVLKARQTGLSTVGMAIQYAMASQNEAVNALVVADDVDGANYLFSMQKLYHEKLGEHLKPKVKHSNEKKLEFEEIHSQILIDTSENLSAGRKYTFRLVHLSECSRFKDLKTLMLGINQSVPRLAGTIVIGETTANGMNQFYDEWVACEKAMEEGTSDWVTFFVPWFDVKEYSLPLIDGKLYPIDSIDFITPSDRENFLVDEKVQREKYVLSDEQVNWRRWCIVNNCNRSVLQFCQEYPDSAKTAFISTGDNFFDKRGLSQQEEKKPLAVGHIIKEEGKYIFREDSVGLFRIYEYPKKGEQYCIGGDPAEGLEHGDKCAGVVLNKRTNKTACIYNHNVSPDRFEEDLIKMGYFYNESVIACESKGYGYSINQGLYKRYGKVYRKLITKTGIKEQTLELGWNTNRASRPMILAQLQDEIKEFSTDLLDKDLIQQCWTFVNNLKRGQPEAEKGKHDDLIMARAIAGQVRVEQPFKEKFFKAKTPKRFRGLSGY